MSAQPFVTDVMLNGGIYEIEMYCCMVITYIV